MTNINDRINKITVTISCGRRSYSEDIDLENEREMFEEWQTNGANPHMENQTFYNYHRPLEMFEIKDIHNIKDHFIYGWFECFAQSDNVPNWMRIGNDPLLIKVDVLTE